MIREQAEKAAMEMRSTGFVHHSWEEERSARAMFSMEREDFERIMNSEYADEVYHRYLDVLAQDPVRAYKNSLICAIAGVCRIAVSYGVELEYSFALSDYYINELEKKYELKALIRLTREILLHYYDLVKSANQTKYAMPIDKAIRYINRSLYCPCSVKDVAAYVKLEPHYFSTLFRREVGLPPSKYIMKQKLAESKRLLQTTDRSLSQIAASLCFYDLSHFSRNFKQEFGCSPSRFEG